MERSRLLNVLLVLLIIVAAVVLAQMLWQLLSGFADIILIFILGWIVSFVLDPLVTDLSERPFSPWLADRLVPIVGRVRANRLVETRLPRTLVVACVYLGVVVLIIVFVVLIVPPTVIQLTQLGSRLPEYTAQAPAAGVWAQNQLAQFGVRLDVEAAVRSALSSLQGIASTVIQNALGIFSGILSFLANLFLILILSFYFSLDGSRIRNAILNVVPESFQREANYLARSVNRTFGGFIRGQFLQGLLMGIGTAIALTALGLNFVLAASLFSTLFMVIPLVGSALSLIPPLLVVLFQAPELLPWLFVALYLYQFIVVNMLMPRVFSEALGLHPLLVLAALLVGVKIGGFWGAFFGIPVTGVMWAMVVFFFEQQERGRAAGGGIAASTWEGTERRVRDRRRTGAPDPSQKPL